MVRARKPRAQTGLRLEPEMLERLRASEHGLSNEIRDRVERTFKEDAIDPVTRELREIVLELARLLEADYGRAWHKSPAAHQAFSAALMRIVAGYTPEVDHSRPPAASDLMEPEWPPEHLGQIRAEDVQRSHSYPHLEAAKQARGKMRLKSMKAKRTDHE